ncbi:MAG: hypothetical protein ACK4GL_11650 [Flavobacteriales bacterium]
MKITTYKFVCFLIVALLMQACAGSGNNNERNDELNAKYDSLLQEIKALRKQIQKDTQVEQFQTKPVELPKPSPKEEPKPVKEIKREPIEKPVVDKKKETTPNQKPVAENDTIYHYFSNRKLSVKVHPFMNGRRKIQVYNLVSGKVNIELEDVRLSYSVSHRLRFRPDGSLEKVNVHENPGASRYWHECEMTFSNTNEPQWQTCEQLPMDQLRFPDKYFWNKATGQWVKQEAVKEQPVPLQNRQ